MRIQTILNQVEKFKSFVYGEARLEKRHDGLALVVEMEPRKNSRVFCSGCGRPGRTYDRLKERRFEFVPIWGILVFLSYRMRRVDCKRWTKRLRRGMGGAVWVGCADWEEVDRRKLLV